MNVNEDIYLINLKKWDDGFYELKFQFYESIFDGPGLGDELVVTLDEHELSELASVIESVLKKEETRKKKRWKKK